jgi:hypothetical protein
MLLKLDDPLPSSLPTRGAFLVLLLASSWGSTLRASRALIESEIFKYVNVRLIDALPTR